MILSVESVMMKNEMKLLSVKEIASQIGRSDRYVWWMRQKGFKMVAGRATLEDAMRFLEANPKPSRRKGDPSPRPDSGPQNSQAIQNNRN